MVPPSLRPRLLDDVLGDSFALLGVDVPTAAWRRFDAATWTGMERIVDDDAGRHDAWAAGGPRRAPAGGVSAAAVSTGSPGPRVCPPGERRPGPPASRPPVQAPSAARCFASRAGRSGHRPALRTWPGCRRGHGSGTAGSVTRSPQDARRPRCRRGGVRIGCAPGPTSSRRHDTRPAPPMHGPARAPTRHRLPPFRAQRLRPGGTTGLGETHHPRPFMIAVVVTLRGSGTESDPEPMFRNRRHQTRTRIWACAPRVCRVAS